MAIYRQVHLSFWTDSKVDDDFTPEDKYFYLYLITNPHTSLCGCYEISMKQMERETGYSSEVVNRLIDRMQNIHKVIIYSRENKEMLIVKWHKYNWNESQTLRTSIQKIIQTLKTKAFRDYLNAVLQGQTDTVCIGYLYPMDTTYTVTVTDTVSVSNTVSNKKDKEEKTETPPVRKKTTRHKHGEYGHVLLSDEELEKLNNEYGSTLTDQAVTYLDEYMEMKGKTYKNCYLTMKKWVFDAVNEKAERSFSRAKQPETSNPFLKMLWEEEEKEKKNG